MNRKGSILFIILSYFCLRAFSQKRFTLEECYQLALRNNTTIKQAENAVISSSIDRKTAILNLLPTFTYNMSHFFSFGRNIDPVTNSYINGNFGAGLMNVNAQLNVISGFTTLNTIKQSEYIVQSSEFAKDKAILDLLTGITLSYSKLLFIKEQTAIIGNNINTIINELKMVNEKINAGLLSKYEYYVINARLNNEKADMVAARNDSLEAMLELKQFINIPYNQEFDIALIDTQLLSNISGREYVAGELIEMLLQKNPAVQQAITNKSIARLGWKIAKGSLFPSVTIAGNVISNYKSDKKNIIGDKVLWETQVRRNLGENVSIRFHVPIFSHGELSNNIKKEKINMSNAEYALQETEKTAIGYIIRLVNDLNAAQQVYLATTAAWQQNNLFYSMYEEKYRLGQVSSLELITAKDILNTTNSKYLQAKLQLFFKYRLLELLKNDNFR